MSANQPKTLNLWIFEQFCSSASGSTDLWARHASHQQHVVERLDSLVFSAAT